MEDLHVNLYTLTAVANHTDNNAREEVKNAMMVTILLKSLEAELEDMNVIMLTIPRIYLEAKQEEVFNVTSKEKEQVENTNVEEEQDGCA